MIAKKLALLLAFTFVPSVGNACEPTALLDGVVTIPQCDSAAGMECVPGQQAVYEALQALDIPETYTIGAQTSPWRIYDSDGRIMAIEDIAAAIRKGRTDSDKRVHLAGSWTAARPDGGDSTLARRLSSALDGFPVDGSDGFLWLSPEGKMRTTRQAFTAWSGWIYSVVRGDDVLTALVPGSLAQFEDRFAQDGISAGVLQAGIGFDVFMLCPTSALAAFERAGEMGNPIGAYNAGLMHAENGEYEAAMAWLEKASTLGEAKADATLFRMRAGDRGSVH